MIKINFLGTCSGTEPMLGRHHCSIVFEIGEKVYWFDAGENCSHAAHTSGIDVQRVRAVFISHMHIDHIGGLANLIFTIRKVAGVTKKPHINGNSYDVFVPDFEKFAAIKLIGNGYRPEGSVTIVDHEVSDGVLFEDENVRVTALHNDHLREADRDGWHSYSYLIEAEGKRVLCSGDLAHPTVDFPPVDDLDAAILEGAHFDVTDYTEIIKEKNIRSVYVNHYGNYYGRINGANFLTLQASIAPIPAELSTDGMEISL